MILTDLNLINDRIQNQLQNMICGIYCEYEANKDEFMIDYLKVDKVIQRSKDNGELQREFKQYSLNRQLKQFYIDYWSIEWLRSMEYEWMEMEQLLSMLVQNGKKYQYYWKVV